MSYLHRKVGFEQSESEVVDTFMNKIKKVENMFLSRQILVKGLNTEEKKYGIVNLKVYITTYVLASYSRASVWHGLPLYYHILVDWVWYLLMCVYFIADYVGW